MSLGFLLGPSWPGDPWGPNWYTKTNKKLPYQWQSRPCFQPVADSRASSLCRSVYIYIYISILRAPWDHMADAAAYVSRIQVARLCIYVHIYHIHVQYTSQRCRHILNTHTHLTVRIEAAWTYCPPQGRAHILSQIRVSDLVSSEQTACVIHGILDADNDINNFPGIHVPPQLHE